MYSQVTVFNMALGFMGTGQMLNSANERVLEAIHLNVYWDNARRTVLRDFPYSFAQKRKQLASVQKPDGYSDFEYAFALPSDYLKVNYITDTSGITSNDGLVDNALTYHRTVFSDSQNVLLCNLQHCILDYTSDITDVARADESFIEMLAYKLAAMACVPILKSSSKLQELNTLYNTKLQQAMQNDATSRKLPKKVDSWVAVAKGN